VDLGELGGFLIVFAVVGGFELFDRTSFAVMALASRQPTVPTASVITDPIAPASFADILQFSWPVELMFAVPTTVPIDGTTTFRFVACVPVGSTCTSAVSN